MAKKAMGPAFGRLFKDVFVCLKCNAKIKASPVKVGKGAVKCRKCRSHKLRPKAKEPRGAGKASAASA